jgi:hypothetical protein
MNVGKLEDYLREAKKQILGDLGEVNQEVRSKKIDEHNKRVDDSGTSSDLKIDKAEARTLRRDGFIDTL